MAYQVNVQTHLFAGLLLHTIRRWEPLLAAAQGHRDMALSYIGLERLHRMRFWLLLDDAANDFEYDGDTRA